MSVTLWGEELLKLKGSLEIRMDGYKLVTNKSGENREGSLTITTEFFQEGFPEGRSGGRLSHSFVYNIRDSVIRDCVPPNHLLLIPLGVIGGFISLLYFKVYVSTLTINNKLSCCG